MSKFSPRMQSMVRVFSWMTRMLPSDNDMLRRFLLGGTQVFDPYSFDFTFRCWRTGLLWSARAFPEEFTRHMVFNGIYQQDVLYWIKTLCKRGDTVFDIGAFHGLMSTIASKAVGPTGRVIAFEPNEASRTHLQAHLSLNRCTNVTVESTGLMDQQKEYAFYAQAGNSSWNSSFVRAFVDASQEVEPVTINCTTVDEYVERTGLVPRLMKIDTEGTEFMVLQGAIQTIQRHRPILLMEFNPVSAEKAGTSVEELLRLLERMGYGTRVVPAKRYGGYDLRVHVPFSEEVPTLEGLANVACIPSEVRI
ncbi:MAG: FkbM family methyltransferase [Deltaproteobacteria bacterium]|nr:FkbM family methyltransferase [Deltaproteobacteria bacterium]